MPPRAKKSRVVRLADDRDGSDTPSEQRHPGDSAPAGPSSTTGRLPAAATEAAAAKPTRARRSTAQTVDYRLLGEGEADIDDHVDPEVTEQSDDSLGSSVHSTSRSKRRNIGRRGAAAQNSAPRTLQRRSPSTRLVEADGDDDDDPMFVDEGDEAPDEDEAYVEDEEAEDDDDYNEENEDEDISGSGTASRRRINRGQKDPKSLRDNLANTRNPAPKCLRSPKSIQSPAAKSHATNAKLGKNHYGIADVCPSYFPGSSGSGIIQLDEILPLDQIGNRRPRMKQLRNFKAQKERSNRHRASWQTNNHYMQVNEQTLAGADWAWYPGKDGSEEEQRRLREQVEKYWQVRRAGKRVELAQVEEMQRVGGVMLLDTQRKISNLSEAESKAFMPPLFDVCAQSALPPAPLRSVEDFVERGPYCSSTEGNINVAMGVPIKDEQGQSKQRSFELGSRRAVSLQHCGLSLGPEGFIINAGSFVPSLDWAPHPAYAPLGPEYLAVAVSLTSPPVTVPDHPLGAYSEGKGAVQVWTIGSSSGDHKVSSTSASEVESQCRLEYTLCLPKGEVRHIKWSPCGADLRDDENWKTSETALTPPRIGLLACVLSNQKVGVFAMPTPRALRQGQSMKGKERQSEPVHVELEPLLEFPIYGRHRQALCLDWGGGERLVAGCSDGTLICWPIGSILRSLTRNPGERSPLRPNVLPSHSLEVHECAILSLSFLQLPPRPTQSPREQDTTADKDEEVVYDHDGLPHAILSTALDGSVKIVDLDLADLAGDLPSRREPGYSTSFFPYLGTWLAERGDNTVRLINPKPLHYGRSHLIASHDGRCTAVDGSPFHPMIASGGADGAVKVANAVKNIVRDPHKYHWPVYRLDLNRFTGELRYVDNILPAPFIFRAHTEGPRANTSLGSSEHHSGINPGAWHPSVRITSVRWNPNACAPVLLASASALGLVRVDMLCAYDAVKSEESDQEGREERESGHAE